MNSQKDKRVLRALILGTCAGFILWVILLALRVTGHTDMHWALVLTGFAWLSWIVYALIALAALFIHLGRIVWRWCCCVSCRELRAKHDSQKCDKYAEIYGTERKPGETDKQLMNRIIKIITYKGWPPRPQPLSGKALELRAWQDFQIRRKPGETDDELRARCMNEADNEVANAPW